MYERLDRNKNDNFHFAADVGDFNVELIAEYVAKWISLMQMLHWDDEPLVPDAWGTGVVGAPPEY
eukprot:12496366-Prorocentrum_lima.AAC.1